MRLIGLAVILTVGLTLAPLAAEAQSAGKVYRIGFILTVAPNEAEHLIKALDEGLRELGYVEGRNIVFERRFAEGKQERLPALAAELVRLNVDVIVTGSNPVIAAVKQATAKIPVVMAASRDPVGAGFIASVARPGGNITGLANDPAPEILGKNLELLKEAIPRASRMALLWNPVPPAAGTYKNAVESAARKLGVTLQPVEVRGRNEFEGAFAAMVRGSVLMGSWCFRTPCCFQLEIRSPFWRRGTACPQSISRGSTRRAGASCPMGRTWLTSSGAPQCTSTRSSEAPSQAILRWSSP